MKEKCTWALLSQYRNALLGAAALEIMIFHYFNHIASADRFAGIFVRWIGSIGVEWFALLSGMGMYYSFRKDSSVPRFYRRRFTRVLVPYLLIAGPLLLIQAIQRSDLIRFPMDVTFLSFVLQGERAVWYIPFILLAYLLYPIVDKAIRKGMLWYIGVVGVTFAVIYGLKVAAGGYYERWEIALWRLIDFEAGVYLGKAAYEKRRMGWMALVSAVLCLAVKPLRSVLGAAFNVIPPRVISLAEGYGLLMLLVLILSRISWRPLLSVLNGAGTLSLELYLSHVLIRGCFGLAGIETGYIAVYLLMAALSVLVSVSVHRLSGRLLRK